MNQDKIIDFGPLLTLRKKLNIEKLKKSASIEDRFINLIIKIINKGRKSQRFVVNWRTSEDQELVISIGATVRSDATENEIKELKTICGHAIVPEKDVTGVVHDKLEKMDRAEAKKNGIRSLTKFNKCIYKGGLSFGISYESNELFFSEDLGLIFTNRSTRQFHSQQISSIGRMCLFYDFISHETGTKYDAKENEFSNRVNSLSFNIERSSIMAITKLIAKTILEALKKSEKDIRLSTAVFFKNEIDYTDCKSSIFEDIWEEQLRYNKQNITDYLLTTICVACGYNDTSKPGRFWFKRSDDEIVYMAMKEAKEAGIKLDLNKVPDNLKDICGQLDFSTTALMFAAKKTDINIESRFNLVIFLIEHGADPAQEDKDGHNALWYAQKKGNTEIAKYLSLLMDFRESLKLGYKIDIKNFIEILRSTANAKKINCFDELKMALFFIEGNNQKFNFGSSLKFLKLFSKIKPIVEIFEENFLNNSSWVPEKTDHPDLIKMFDFVSKESKTGHLTTKLLEKIISTGTKCPDPSYKGPMTELFKRNYQLPEDKSLLKSTQNNEFNKSVDQRSLNP